LPRLFSTIRATATSWGKFLIRDHATTGEDRARAAHDARGPAVYDPGDWAWEFLRRNPDYRAAWRVSVPRRLPHVTLQDGTALLRLRRRYPQAERWGLYAFADPTMPARRHPVFWCPAALRQLVRVRAAPPGHRKGAKSVTLSSFNVERTAAIGVDDIPLVLMKGSGVMVPLEIHGVAALSHPFAPVFEIDGFADLSGQTEALKRLQRFAEQAPKADSRLGAGADERLHHALIALDESQNGKTYRQIAITIFGEARVAEDWNGPSQFLKDRTRRLVAKGRELMMGGYRDLLT
jgi:hypothetical protein